MATLPTDIEKARMALDTFKHFGTRPGEVLMLQNFLAVAMKKGWRTTDVVEGLEYGSSQGWFEEGPNHTIRLTAAGYDQI